MTFKTSKKVKANQARIRAAAAKWRGMTSMQKRRHGNSFVRFASRR